MLWFKKKIKKMEINRDWCNILKIESEPEKFSIILDKLNELIKTLVILKMKEVIRKLKDSRNLIELAFSEYNEDKEKIREKYFNKYIKDVLTSADCNKKYSKELKDKAGNPVK